MHSAQSGSKCWKLDSFCLCRGFVVALHSCTTEGLIGQYPGKPLLNPMTPGPHTGPMTVTARDDNMVRTHEEAEALLRYTALGATIVFDKLKRSKRADTVKASREWTLVMDAAPSHSVNHTDIYCLPFRADNMIRRVKELLAIAQASLEPLCVGAHST